MKILDRVYIKYLDRKKELDEELSETLERVEKARAEGDLSENADYKKAMSDLDLINHDYMVIAKIIDEGEPVSERTSFTEIDVGCKFDLSISIDIDSGIVDEDSLGVFKLIGVDLSNSKSGSNISGVVVIGGETDDLATEGILSSLSPLGKYLMGKSYGTYNIKGPQGDSLRVVVKPC